MNHEGSEFEFYSQRVAETLQAYGKVQNLSDESEVPYDPYALTHNLQATLLAYIMDPPTDEDGYQKWLVCCKSRQSGASTTISSGYYVKAQYTPGWEHITSADKKERADYLFDRVNYLHNRWPEDLRVPQQSHGQLRSFHWTHNAKMIVRSGGGGGMGIGASASSWHWSEVPLWPDAKSQWSYALPAIINRKKAQMIFESTPFPMNEPSSEFFMELCENARSGDGRFVFAFEPFWDGKLNTRRWRDGDRLTNEEIRLMEIYGKYGLRKENLAFRRQIMDTDEQIRRNPDLFRVFYPFDDLTCWISQGSGAVKSRHLERHLKDLIDFPFDRGYIEYANVKPGASYVIGVDPSGYGARDHAAFHVFEVWAGQWRQVATYASLADPPEFTRFLDRVGRKFNNALIGVERNGVGVGVIALLEEMRYPNLHYDNRSMPGIYKRAEAQLLSQMIEALTETLVIRDRDTIAQLRTYRSDRELERSVKAEILQVGKNGGRRARHHWDKVSALMMVCVVAASIPQRTAPMEAHEIERLVPFSEMTMDELMRYDKRRAEFSARNRPKRSGAKRNKYRSVRKR